MRDGVHIRSDGRLIYNRQDGCVDTSYILIDIRWLKFNWLCGIHTHIPVFFGLAGIIL